ncbi:MAG: hypothetical protein PWP65_8 [Clostridia bacterium]|nr:hypothetical protein [Clostridia bacterium]
MEQVALEAEIKIIRKLKSAGKLQEAERRLQRALERFPGATVLQASLADVYRRRGRYLEAGFLADEVLKTDPVNWQALVVKGDIAYKEGRWEEAGRLFAAAFALYPTSFLAVRLSQAYLASGQGEAAAGVLRQMLAKNRDDGRLWRQLAQVLEKLGDMEGAAQAWSEVLRLDPGDQFAYRSCLKLSSSGRPPEEVLQELEIMLKTGKRGQNPHLYILKGNLLYQMGHYAKAAEAYRQGLEISPGNLYLLGQLGYSLYRLGQVKEALATLQEAFRRKPRDIYLRTTLLSLYRSLGRQAEGAEFLRELARQNPELKALWGLANRLEKEAGAGAKSRK